MSLVLDLHITHERFGCSSDPSITGHLHYPNDVDRSHNEDTNKIRKYRSHRKTDRFFAVSGVHFPQTNSGLFHFRRAAFSSQLKEKVGNTLVKAAVLRLSLNIDTGEPITSRTHTHPSHSQTSRLLTSSLSSGVPVPRATQCMRGVSIPQL